MAPPGSALRTWSGWLPEWRQRPQGKLHPFRAVHATPNISGADNATPAGRPDVCKGPENHFRQNLMRCFLHNTEEDRKGGEQQALTGQGVPGSLENKQDLHSALWEAW